MKASVCKSVGSLSRAASASAPSLLLGGGGGGGRGRVSALFGMPGGMAGQKACEYLTDESGRAICLERSSPWCTGRVKLSSAVVARRAMVDPNSWGAEAASKKSHRNVGRRGRSVESRSCVQCAKALLARTLRSLTPAN